MLLWRAAQYVRYRWRAKNRHGIHSPFVYRLLDEVIYDRSPRESYRSVDNIKSALLQDDRTITITDLGAGSTISASRQRKVSDIARNSAKEPKYGQLLHRLVAHFRPMEMAELGTSFGISALYQVSGNVGARLTTFEGCPQTAAIARESFQKAERRGVQLIEGNFDETLKGYLDSIERLDWFFNDGNHRKEPTLRYFEQCLEKSHAETVFIFDDIYWSKDMAEAWEMIKAHPKVSVTLDLFQIGIVFLRNGQAKQDFVIRF
jgi:predicted O-methyltransferase YrrM